MKTNKGLIIAAGACVLGALLIALSISLTRGDWSKLNMSTIEYEKLQYDCTSDISAIEIYETSNEVMVVPGDVKKATVNYFYNEKYLNYEITEQNGTLTVKRLKGKKNIDFSFGFEFEWPEVVVTVPDKEYEKICINLSSGGAKVSDIDVNRIDVSNSSGLISLENVDASMIDVSNTSGAINLSDITADTVEATSTSGGVKLSNVTAPFVTAEATSGSLSLENIVASDVNTKVSSGFLNLRGVKADNINGKTTSGSVKVENLDAAKSISLEATSGSIRGTIIGNESDFSIISNTGSGSSNVESRIGGDKELNLKTTSGSIHVDFE